MNSRERRIRPSARSMDHPLNTNLLARPKVCEPLDMNPNLLCRCIAPQGHSTIALSFDFFWGGIAGFPSCVTIMRL